MLSREHQIILDFLLELTREEQQGSSQSSFDDVEISSEELERINDFFNDNQRLVIKKLEEHYESKRNLSRY